MNSEKLARLVLILPPISDPRNFQAKKMQGIFLLLLKIQSIRSAFLGAPFPGARSYFTGARKERAPFSGEVTQVGARS